MTLTPRRVQRSQLFRRDFLTHAVAAAGSLLIVNARPLVLVAVMGAVYGHEIQSIVGLVGTLTGLAIVVSTGFIPTTVRKFAKPFHQNLGVKTHALRAGLATELAIGLATTVIIFLTALLCTIIAALNGQTLFVVYWVAALPGMLLNPVGFIFTGLFQARSQDVANLRASSTGLIINILAAITLALIHPPASVALAILGLTSTSSATVGLIYRGHKLKQAQILYPGVSGLTWHEFGTRTVSSFRGLGERFAASIDGVVYLTTFSFAITIALNHSPTDGAATALAVSIMRMVVIPLKQFGFVGARMGLRERNQPGALSLATVELSTLVLLVPAAGVLVLCWLYLPLVGVLPPLMVALMVLQLLIEPWAGIRYAYNKVRFTGYTGLLGLLVAYVVVSPVLFTVVIATSSVSATTVWAALLITRLVFAGIQTSRPARDSASG